MSNKIYKSKMKDENRLLGKFVNISLIALSIIFVLLFLVLSLFSVIAISQIRYAERVDVWYTGYR
jgi:L-cystine uptake protein TcyP (sodium:dicarboxylate symporter family)